MTKTARQMLDSPEFKRIAARRSAFSLILVTALFAIYYGYILLVAVDKPLLGRKIGEVTTMGIPLAVAVIVLAWALTAVYVVWANRVHDPDVRDLKRQIQ